MTELEKTTSNDESKTSINIITENNKVVIRFTKQIAWFALDADQAIVLAEHLKKKATELKGKPVKDACSTCSKKATV